MVDVEKGNPVDVENNARDREHVEESSIWVDVEKGNPVDVENNDPKKHEKESSV